MQHPNKLLPHPNRLNPEVVVMVSHRGPGVGVGVGVVAVALATKGDKILKRAFRVLLPSNAL